jgi:uncharacterized protein
MLRIDIRELAQGPVETAGELPADDPVLEGLDVALAQPVRVTGRLQGIGEERFYWQGALRTVVEGECRRCLTPVRVPIQADVAALFTKDPEAQDDPDTYPLAPDATEVDLGPAVREELLLSVPRFAVCRDDCRGLCPQCGQDLNAGSCACDPVVDARWQPLKSLKDKLRSN